MEQLSLIQDSVDEVITKDAKVCSKCDKLKSLSEFSYASGGNYLRTECKKCANELKKVRDKLKLENPPPGEDYKCPICDRDKDEVAGLGGKSNGPWVLDHCHKTNKFRGYLCHECNRKLGGCSEDPEWFDNAKNYLNRS
jgi:hypothetical protein